MDNDAQMVVFHDAFVSASQHEPGMYSNLTRFIAVVLCLICSVMVINYFMKNAPKESDSYMPRFIGLIVKLMIVTGLLLVYLI